MPIIFETEDQILKNSSGDINSKATENYKTQLEADLRSSLKMEDPSYTIADLVSNAYKLHTWPGSVNARSEAGASQSSLYYDIFPGSNPTYNKEFDAIDYLEETGREDAIKFAAYAQTKAEADNLIKYFDDTNKRRQVLSNGGLLGIGATLGVQLLDPTILIPGGAVFKGAKTVSNIIKSAAVGSVTAAGAIGTQERLIQSNNPSVTNEDVGYALAAGAVLGGALGGILGAIGSKSRRAMEDEISQGLKGNQVKYGIKKEEDGSIGLTTEFNENVSAARVQSGSKEDLGLDFATRAVAAVFQPGSIFRSNSIIGHTSESVIMRQFTLSMLDTPLITEGVRKGALRGDNAELLIKYDTAETIKLQGEVFDNYNIYRARTKAEGGKPMSLREFDAAIDRTLRGTIDTGIKEITDVSTKYRKLLNYALKAMKRVKLIDEDTDLNDFLDMLTRVYDQEKIIFEKNNNKSDFIEALSKGIRREEPHLDADEILEKAIAQRDHIIGMGDDQLDIAMLFDNLAKSPKGGFNKFLKTRTVKSTDAELDNYLKHEGVANATMTYLTEMAAVRQQEMLQAMGHESLGDVIKAIKTEYDTLAIREPGKKNWTKLAQKDMQLARDIFASINGSITKGDPAALRVWRKYTTMVMLEAVTISSFPDVAMPIFRHGPIKAVVDGWGSELKKISAGFEANKVTNAELREIGVGLELISNRLLQSLAEIGSEPIGLVKGGVERTFDTGVDLFGKFTGLSYWNNFHKQIAGHLTTNRLIKGSRQLLDGSISSKDALRLRELNISPEDATKFLEQYNKHGQTYKGSDIPNFSKWDPEVKAKFGRAVLHEVDLTVLKPGAGDFNSLAMSTGLAKTLLMFKSFMMAASNKLLLSAVNRRDADALIGIVALVGMGMLTYTINQKRHGRKIDYSPGNLVFEGLSRSGALGYIADPMFGLNPWGSSSRYAGVNATGVILGPSIGMIKDMAAFSTKAARVTSGTDDHYTQGDANALARILPWAQIPFLTKPLTDTAIDKILDPKEK